MFSIYVEFLDLLFFDLLNLNKSTTVLSNLLSLFLTTSLLLVLNIL